MTAAEPPAAAATRPFGTLTPDAVLEAAEALGLEPDGHLFALNSYENRVYRVGRFEHDAGGDEVLPCRALERSRRSSRSTLLPASSQRRRLPSPRRYRSRARRCITTRAFAWRSFRCAPGRHPSSIRPERASCWAARSRASTRGQRADGSSYARH